jgi:spore maturation protein CgeB
MKAVFFYHAFTSCWNNGNAHFLRGVTRELARLGHEVAVYEPSGGWSRANALKDGGAAILSDVLLLVPGVDIRPYKPQLDIGEALEGAHLVVVHEWNPPELIAAIGRYRTLGAEFTLLFHDTHHRAVTSPEELAHFDLSGYDGVLAFGEVLREIYVRRGWARRAFTWHEAADIALYRPMPEIGKQCDLVWIGNWGDNERSAELAEYLVEPVRALKLTARIYGVRYPAQALEIIEAAGICYGGWLPNHRAPHAFAQARATIHVPRGPYARQLPGIPTIRMFEALACGIPLISAPWSDEESLFPPGCYLQVSSGESMSALLAALLSDTEMAASLSRAGLDAVLERHTCRHRVQELLTIVEMLNPSGQASRSLWPQHRIAS